MTSTWLFILLEISVIACGLVSGVFLSFSDFVMRSLAGARPAGGIESMQIINREVFKSVFMVLFLGWCAVSPILIGYAYFYVSGSASALIIAGGAIYLAGVFVVSLVFNVPMNQRLDAMDYSAADAATYWKTFVPRWTFWNYVRVIASAASAICYLVACVWLAQGAITTG